MTKDRARPRKPIWAGRTTVPVKTKILLLPEKRRRGFAVACNQWARTATAPDLLFLTPDCYFEPGALSRLAADIYEDPGVGMARAVV